MSSTSTAARPACSPFTAAQHARLARWLPAALALIGALVPACTPDPKYDEMTVDELVEVNRFARYIAQPEPGAVEEPPPELENSDDEAAGTGQRHKGEEGRMGRPSAKMKSGLYAMKGPKDPGGLGLVGTGRGGSDLGSRQAGILGSPYGGAFAVGNDDADVWGGLEATHGTAGLGDQYAAAKEHAWAVTQAAPLSTFAVDVDTASYANIRRFLGEGSLPPKGAVRVEEMINYFDYAYPEPTGEHPIGVTAEVAPCPWNPQHKLVHVGVQAKTIQATQVPPRNLVFLVDVSGSMNSEDKLPLVRRGLLGLVDTLRPEDRISLVVYAGSTGVVLEPTPGDRKQEIRAAIERLDAGGGTNGAAGIVLAYREARRHFAQDGINRVILATDGDFNVGLTSHDDMVRLIEREREKGVFLTVLGVGRGNFNDHMMEQVADHGNGNYAYLDSEAEARKVLVAEASGTLVTVAKDVKLQVEWNPNTVAGYRLIGYENRALAAEDFSDDKKDAGEIGAGDSVTALYEIVPAGRPVPGAKVDRLRYLQPSAGKELLTVKVRYKEPEGRASTKFELAVSEQRAEFAEASPQLRLSTAVAAFGLKLRGSDQVEGLDLARIAQWAQGADLPDPDGHRRELVGMIADARKLMVREAVHASNALP